MVEPDGKVVILDFGLVAELQPWGELRNSFGTVQFVGTPEYASPEHGDGVVSEASDWYSIGVMLFQALTGELPFTGERNRWEILAKKQQHDAPSLKIRDEIPSDLASLVDRLLQRKPEGRLPNDEFDALLVGEDSNISTRSITTTATQFGGSGSIVGREKQLAQLEWVQREWQGTPGPRVTMICGRSGEGKSALAEVFLRPLQESDKCVVLSGRCYDRESVPFKVIDSLIDPLIVSLRRLESERQLDRYLPRDIVFLAQLFPVLRRVDAIDDRVKLAALNLDERQIRYRGFAALRDLLRAISADRSVILFVDDLQWGDEESVQVVLDLLEPPNAPNLLFLGGYRSDEVDASEFLKEWQHARDSGDVSHAQDLIEVGPLNIAQCAELVEMRLGLDDRKSADIARDLHARTQGNPFFMEELIQAFDREGENFVAVPLHEIIEGKLNELPDQARPLLEIIAVSGKAMSLEDVEQILGSGDSAFTTLTHMRSEKLVRLLGAQEAPHIDTYHDKVRETVLSQMSPEQRKGVHLAFGEYVEERQNVSTDRLLVQSTDGTSEDLASLIPTATLFDLAFHYFEAGDPRAFAYQLLAGERAIQSFAFENAMDHLSRALAVLPMDADPTLQFRVFERLGLTCSRLHRSDEAYDYYGKALAVAPNGVAKATSHLGIGYEHKTLGYVEKSMKSFDEALKHVGIHLPRTTPAYLTRIMTSACYAFVVPTKWQRSRSRKVALHAAKASEVCHSVAFAAFDTSVLLVIFNALLGVRMAAKSGNLRLTALSYSTLAGQFAWTGNTLLVEWCLRKSRAASPSKEDKELLAFQSVWDGVASASFGEHQKAIQRFDQGLQFSIDCGDLYTAGYGAVVRSHSHGVVSSVNEELEQAQQVLEILERVGDRRAICWAEFLNAHPLARSGQLPEAHAFMKRAVRFVDEEPLVLTESVARSIYAFVLIQSSHYRDAALHAERGWRVCDENKMHISYLVRNLPLLMESLAGQRWNVSDGHLDRAMARRVCRRSHRFQKYALLTSPILRTRGRLLCRLGRVSKAQSCFEKALDNARRQGATNEVARCLLDGAAVGTGDTVERRQKAVRLLLEIGAVIPRAESWLLGDQYEESVLAPEFDLEVWEEEHGAISPKTDTRDVK